MKKAFLSIVSAILVSLMLCMAVSASAGLPFEDVQTGSWYYNAVEFCHKNGFISGMSENEFGVNAGMTRAMFVTVLSKMGGVDRTQYTDSSFTDVVPGSWYASSVEWAYQNGIVSGYGNTFGPNDYITREQMAVIFYEYADWNGYSITQPSVASIQSFPDYTNISSWAHTASAWLVENGVISGNSDGYFAPGANARRCEVAVMLHKFSTEANLCTGEIAVARSFSNNMVIQRNDTIKIWGWTTNNSDNGKKVCAEFGGLWGSALVENGSWTITLNGTLPENSVGQRLSVYGKNQQKNFDNILVGDVYFVIGQSNVNYTLGVLFNENPSTRNKVQIDDNDNIRLFRNSAVDAIDNAQDYPPQGSPVVLPGVVHTRGWQLPSMDAANFSALGYIYAKQIYNQVGVPIGMVEVDASGCPLSAFMPNELADKYNSEAEDDAHKFDVLDSAGTAGPTYTDNIYHMFKTRWVYNQLINPLTNMSISGLLWYQGESDFLNLRSFYGAENGYIKQFTDLMTSLRSKFANASGDFPVYIVELPSSYNKPDWYTGQWAYIDFGLIRAEMGMIPTKLSNSYMAASSDAFYDTNYWNSLHPYCKYEQASRLSNLALSINYGNLDKNYVAGPQFDESEYSDNYIDIHYNYVGDGLTTANNDKENVLGFRVITEDGFKTPDSAEIIDENTVRVTYGTGGILGVTYNSVTTDFFDIVEFNDLCTVSLCSSTHIPAIAFTDYR